MDWTIPERARKTVPEIAVEQIESDEVHPLVKVQWARVLVQFDSNNLKRSALRKYIDSIADQDTRYLEASGVKTAEELRRDPEYLSWYRDRAVAADAGEPGSLCITRLVAVGAASSSD